MEEQTSLCKILRKGLSKMPKVNLNPARFNLTGNTTILKLRLCMIPADITFVALFPSNHWLFIEKIVLDDSAISELEKR